MPLLHDMQSSIGQATCFTKLDAFKGYWQLGLDPKSGNIVAIQAGSRLYKPLRAPQGATSSAQEFQSAMRNMVGDDYDKLAKSWQEKGCVRIYIYIYRFISRGGL